MQVMENWKPMHKKDKKKNNQSMHSNLEWIMDGMDQLYFYRTIIIFQKPIDEYIKNRWEKEKLKENYRTNHNIIWQKIALEVR